MLVDLSIQELAQGLRKNTFTIKDLVEECFLQIEKHNPSLNALISVRDKTLVLNEAEEKQKLLRPASSVLYGLPYILKDSYNTVGIRTTAASNILKNFNSVYNATVHQRLQDAGAILIGKANMDAWGHGATNENSDFGPVKNPYDLSRVAGGSGGGVAAAIATRMAVFGIGEDTGGSIRNPAAWNNITALKVTYGRVSRYGCIAYASSFDTVGPTAKTVEECTHILEVIAGKDQRDATSSPHSVPKYSQKLNTSIKGKVIGIPKELIGQGLDPEIKENLIRATKEFSKLGVIIKEVSMPMIAYGISVYYLIAPSETSSNLARYDGIRYGKGRKYFNQETTRRIMIGTYALSAGYYDAYYKKAQQARTLFIKEYDKAFSECDALLMPVTPTPPTKIGEAINDPVQNMLLDVYTVTQNPVGVPSLAIPSGFTKNHLPIGMQIVGKMFSEDLLLNIGYAYQQVTDWHKRKPAILNEESSS